MSKQNLRDTEKMVAVCKAQQRMGETMVQVDWLLSAISDLKIQALILDDPESTKTELREFNNRFPLSLIHI